MALVVVHTEKAPIDWHVEFIRRYGIPTGLIDVGVLQKAVRLCDVPVSALLNRSGFQAASCNSRTAWSLARARALALE
ncbi:hypothetical protein CPJ18_11130 [Agrobacterium rosae]|uniref:Uncharacterized protein n=1 Tax=Agrobacterium rosae TaxID=1972867 RepID=A0AAE5RX62_9HYPH|nr:hypothetical protein DXM21_04315 [Agrobacterium rosae]KAA3522734.1 hypothetical protein DXM25_04320 [Agrobacterium rosae]POO51117.1 hypothetical protein CPJ18_11130 [Agrobacterium rosae]